MASYAVDVFAFTLFCVLWLGYAPLLQRVAGGGGVNRDMTAIRQVWLRRMLAREVRIADTNILGHLLNSASFFASTNLLVIAGLAGVLFGGEATLAQVRGVTVFTQAPVWLIELKVALVLVTLARGLLAFVWSIRQINYVLAIVGAAPDHIDQRPVVPEYARAAAEVLTAAVGSFNQGVRGYYFALAAAAWLASPWALALGALAAFALLAWRQIGSDAAGSIQRVRAWLESHDDGAKP